MQTTVDLSPSASTWAVSTTTSLSLLVSLLSLFCSPLLSICRSLSPLVSLSVVHATADDGTNDVALMCTFVITTHDTQLATACFIVATAGF